MNETKKSILEDEVPFHQQKLEQIKNDIKAQGEEKKTAFSQGETFHDNPAGEQVEMEQKMSSGQYSELSNLLQRANILSLKQIKQSTQDYIVTIGKKVELLIDGEKKEIQIGGYNTPIAERTSYNAPLIQTLILKEEGDEIEVILQGKKKIIEILSVSYL